MKEFIQKAVDLFSSIPNFAMGLLLLLFAVFVGAVGALAVKAVLKRTRLGRRIREIEKNSGLACMASGHAISTVGKLVFLVLFLVFLPSALSKLGLEGVNGTVNLLTERLVGYIPNLIACILLLLLGVLLADVVFLLLGALFASVALDEKINGWLMRGKEQKPFAFSSVLSYTAKSLIIVLFAVEGINALGFSVLTAVGRAVIAYLPSLLVAVLFALAAFFVCRILDSLLKNGTPILHTAIKAAIITLAAFIVLSHLGIAPLIVNTAFIILIGACGVALALALGLGGRQFVQENLSGIKLFKKKEQDQKQKGEENQNQS